MSRCSWVDESDADYVLYHDKEWGVLVTNNERLLFEMLVLEAFVAGLSWQCVLHKRKAFKAAFDNFEPLIAANYGEQKVSELVKNPDIIRHIGKIRATITNARIFCEIQKEFGSFEKYLQTFTGGKIIKSDGVETTSELSDKISKNLKRRGMKFVGSTTIFSYLCAIGMIDAHQPCCSNYQA